MFRIALAVLLVSLISLSFAAAPAPDAGRSGGPMLDAYYKEITRRLSAKFLDGATTREEWQARRPRLQREYLDMLGLQPLPEKTPLNATVTGTLEKHGVVVEKVHFQSRPGLYVTGNLYRPKASEKKLPTILYVCGHSDGFRDGNKVRFQDHGFWFANNGYVCLIIDTLQLGEVQGKHHGTYNLGRFWWQAAGYTPAGVECWNGVRAIDYLVTRPEVDPEKIGVTGISGGGASTIWIAAADERVKVAVPVSGMSDLDCYVSQKIINGHCDCMLMINTYQWEWTTLAALIAPRPMLFANSDNDTIFPMDGNRRIIAKLRQLYDMYEKPELVDEYVSKGGHAYRPDLRLAIFKFLNKHLKGDTGEIKDAEFAEVPGKELRVFAEDKDLPKDEINSKIDESFVPRATVAVPEKDFGTWQSDLVKKLRDRSFRTFPDTLPAATRFSKEVGAAEKLATEPDILVNLLAPRVTGKGALGTLIIRDNDEQALDDSLLKHRGDGPLRVLTVRPGRPRIAPNYVERAPAILGRTLDTGRLWDVIATVKYLHDNDSEGRSWRVVGRGNVGVIAAYAAIFEPAIAEVVVLDPPASHRDGPIFLNVLQVLDVPDALGLVAPRPLTLIGTKDKAFEKTEAIYKAAGAADKVKRK